MFLLAQRFPPSQRLDDNTNPIVLRLLWATDTARITYAAQEGGSAAGGALTVPAKGSASEDINAVSGTPTAMTATAASGYKFDSSSRRRYAHY